jgi:hypothetical protein
VRKHGEDTRRKRLRCAMATGDRAVAIRAKAGWASVEIKSSCFSAVSLGFATDALRGSAGSFTDPTFSNRPFLTPELIFTNQCVSSHGTLCRFKKWNSGLTKPLGKAPVELRDAYHNKGLRRFFADLDH